MTKIEHILITAGGTVEAIDSVRQIRNTSSGSLCAHIYEALSDYLAAGTDVKSGRAFIVHYVVSAAAMRPEAKENLPISFYTVTDVKSVESVLEKLMRSYKISYVIHGMAVSDFTKDYLIEREELIQELAETLEKAMDEREGLPAEKLREMIRGVIETPGRQLDASAKVSSRAELMLSLKKTPKLIERIKTLSPETFLVGFKLLKGVPEEELIRAAAGMSERCGCDLVLANDLTGIQSDRHEGLLLKGSRVVGRYHTKKEIAAGIAEHILGSASDPADAK